MFKKSKEKLTVEILPLPVVDLSYRFLYRVKSKKISTDWKLHRISYLHSLLKPINTTLKQEAVNGFLVQLAHSEGRTVKREEFNSDRFKVELVRYAISGSPVFQTPHLTPTIYSNFDSDVVKIEYAHIPKHDTALTYLMRIKEPVTTIWSLHTEEEPFKRAGSYADGKLTVYNQHLSVKEVVERDASKYWKEMIKPCPDTKLLDKYGEKFEIIEQKLVKVKPELFRSSIKKESKNESIKTP